MTVKEYARLPDPQGGYTCELVRGMVVREPGPAWSHRLLQFRLARHLHAWTEKTGQGEVGLEGDCILSENPDTVRVPDVVVLLRRRVFDNEPGGWIRGAPDIAIEVLSPSNTVRQMREKTNEYFEAGALRVWIVDPQARSVAIHRPDGAVTLFREGDRLEDAETLPGFALDMAELFERGIIEDEHNGYVALCPEVDVASQGKTVAEAHANLQEALNLFSETASTSEIERRLRTAFE